MRSRYPAVLSTLVVAGLAACARAADTEIGGDLPEWVVGVDPATSIGEVTGPADYVFDRIDALRLLPGAGVAVADRGSSTVRIYGPDGRFVRSMSGEGDGPGEFRYVFGMRLRPPDTLAVYDGESMRLTSFRTDGVLLGTETFRASDGRPEVYLGAFEDGSQVASWIRQEDRDGGSVTPDRMRVARFVDGEDGVVFAEDVGMRRMGSPLPFSPHFLGVVVGDALYHTDGLGGELRVTTASGEERVPIDTGIAPVSVDVAWEELEAALDSGSVERLGELRGAPGVDTVPSISELLVDDEGRLWLKRYDPAVDSHWLLRRRTGGRWLVIDGSGERIAWVSVPDGFRLMDVRGDRVAGVTRDELGVERVEIRTLSR